MRNTPPPLPSTPVRHDLQPHPDFPCRVLGGLTVEAARPAPNVLQLRHRLSGVTDGLVLPPTAPPARTDELWRRTCLEAFVRLPGAPGYRELNLSPGGPWAAYRFDGYREGMANADVPAPHVTTDRDGDTFDLAAAWTLDLPSDLPWQVAVTAVIEAADGSISYWSLRHPAARPDFHHADGFVLELPPISGP
ncbi:DOMON-like domain-containing protein [Phenylobacterium kunshanense]|uniref:DOMON-like domain-containing protein n=1 Tax=Phenylobacterium kunshanense TaxID=1445034 RepID=UPI001F0B936C|nr:DOMON-like domain-containing protein [Phenylobacterium kunshanense]